MITKLLLTPAVLLKDGFYLKELLFITNPPLETTAIQVRNKLDQN